MKRLTKSQDKLKTWTKTMGRLREWSSPIFSNKYKKLLDDFGSKDYTKLLIRESVSDFISYNCSHCGHIQKLQTEDLNTILSHAFRLAYASHLKKSSFPNQEFHSKTRQNSQSLSPSHSPRSNFSYNKASSPILRKESLKMTRTYRRSSLHALSKSEIAELSDCECDLGDFSTINSSSEKLIKIDSPCSSIKKKERLIQDKDSQKSCQKNRRNSSQNVATSPNFIKIRTPTLTDVSRRAPLSELKTYAIDTLNNNNLILSDNSISSDCDNVNSPTEENRVQRLIEKTSLVKKISHFCSTTSESQEDPVHTDSFKAEAVPLISNVFDEVDCGQTTLGEKILDDNRISENKTFTEKLLSNQNLEEKSSRVIRNATSKRLNIVENPLDIVQRHANLNIIENPLNNKILPNIIENPLNLLNSSKRSCSGTIKNAPNPPERCDSLHSSGEIYILNKAPWYQAGIPREIALEILNKEPVGAFMVRESTSKPGCFALSLRVPKNFTTSGIAHYLIVESGKGYRIKGFSKEFSSITELITHHSVMQELLPCPLSLSRYSSVADHKNMSADDVDYPTLSDLRKMMFNV